MANVQLALQVIVTRSPGEARQLVSEKEDIEASEQELQRKHLGQLRDGLTEIIATSNIHQKTMRALKQVNTCFSKVTYPILSETDDLLDSRLSEPKIV